MKTTHTPGPWIVRGGNVIESLSRVYVAKAWMTDGEEECANARLIAASPELFDACKAFVKHIESLPDDTEKCRHLRLGLENRPGELLIEAIAKAEGREK